MSDIVKEIIKDGLFFRIHQDEDAESPRKEFDNATTLLCSHRRYNLGDESNLNPEDIKEQVKGAVVSLKVYMYDHSGITISTTPFSCSWDSGQIGVIFMTRAQILAEHPGRKIVSAKMKKWAIAIMESEIEVYDQYLRGEVYGFTTGKITECEHCEKTSEVEGDSCWGFYGDNPIENGMYDHLTAEFRKLLKDEYPEDAKKYDAAVANRDSKNRRGKK